MMEKYANVPGFVARILQANASEKYVFVTRDGVAANDLDAKPFTFECNVGDECLRNVPEGSLPIVGKDPGEFAIGPNAEPKRETLGMVLLPDMREIDVADLIFVVEIDQQIAVADGNVTHRLFGL